MDKPHQIHLLHNIGYMYVMLSFFVGKIWVTRPQMVCHLLINSSKKHLLIALSDLAAILLSFWNRLELRSSWALWRHCDYDTRHALWDKAPPLRDPCKTNNPQQMSLSTIVYKYENRKLLSFYYHCSLCMKLSQQRKRSFTISQFAFANISI